MALLELKMFDYRYVYFFVWYFGFRRDFEKFVKCLGIIIETNVGA